MSARAWRDRAMPPAGIGCRGIELRFGAFYAGILVAGGILFWMSQDHPALMPAWTPWSFSWPEYLGAALPLLWFFRGLTLSPPLARPPLWRRAFFLLGVLTMYAALQTQFDYLAQHMFFLNRLQQIAIHDFGPFLIALGGGGDAIRRGMPGWARRIADARQTRALLGILRQPLVAATLFVGVFYFWLIPAVHFRAMLDSRLYAVMNWSMVLDGLLFWSVVLDRRPCPPAHLPMALRGVMAFGVMTPQTLLGAVITLAPRDLYPSYALCGRIFPWIDALTDEHLGGIISWVPPLLMSAIAVLIVLSRIMRAADAQEIPTLREIR